jgi:hypothetical protein
MKKFTCKFAQDEGQNTSRCHSSPARNLTPGDRAPVERYVIRAKKFPALPLRILTLQNS